MSKPLRKIEVDGLRVGMYVSRLDRPWLETPFLFQGFFIRNESEIEDLRRYCEFVEIDVEESDAGALTSMSPAAATTDQPTSVTKPRRPLLWQRILKPFGWKKEVARQQPRPGEFYQDTVSTAEELVKAKSVHGEAVGKLMNVLDSIRSGRSISMPDLEDVTSAMVDSVLRNSTAMALLTRMADKDEYVTAHSLESSVWALVFGRHLGLDRDSLTAAGLGGLLLDVGKTRIPEKLLNKKEALTDIELAYIRTHVDFGLEILREAGDVDNRVLEMVATHHERYDGSGYPQGLKGNEIPVLGRIGGIIDSYSAMTNDRPYAKAVSSYDAMRQFNAASDKLFQAEMVEQFIQAIGIFPVGTLVELNTGEIGIVLKERQSNRLQPELAIILGKDKQPLEQFETIDLRQDGDSTPTVWIERGVEPGAYDIDPGDYFL